MDSGNLTIVLHSGKGLKNVKHLSPMNPYAIAWIDGDSTQSKFQTDAAKKGGSDPKWESSMNFNNVSKNKNYILVIDIKHDGTMFDRNIGEVKVPFADLLAGDASGNKVSYQVTIPSGEIKGEVILSYKFSNLVTISGEEDGYVTGASNNDGEVSPAGSVKEGSAKKIAKKVLTKAATSIAEVAVEVAVSSLLN